MRPKPDVSAFSGAAKDPNDLLNGGDPKFPKPPEAQGGGKPKASTMTIEVTKPELTVQKLFRLRWDVANALKAGAVKESATARRRGTETEIVERLLRENFALASYGIAIR